MNTEMVALIKLYAGEKAAVLDSTAGGKKIEDALHLSIIEILKLDWYPNLKAVLSELKTSLENRLNGIVVQKDQIKVCLDAIWEESVIKENDEKQLTTRLEVLQELIRQMFEGVWGKEQKEFFRTVSTIFSNYHSYFISYTNFDAQQMNELYKVLFNSLLLPEDVSGLSFMKKNLLAKAINKFLTNRNVNRGFYDRDDLVLGDELPKEIKSHVSNSFAFIQLISKGTFKHRKTNWCFDEFSCYFSARDQFKQDNQYRFNLDPYIIFVLLEAIPEVDDQIPFVYRPWKKKATDIHLGKRFYEGEINYAGFDKVIDELMKSIYKKKMEILGHIPD